MKKRKKEGKKQVSDAGANVARWLWELRKIGCQVEIGGPGDGRWCSGDGDVHGQQVLFAVSCTHGKLRVSAETAPTVAASQRTEKRMNGHLEEKWPEVQLVIQKMGGLFNTRVPFA